MMAVFCPRREQCEFWPTDGDDHFLRFMRGEVSEPFADADLPNTLLINLIKH